MKQELRVLAVGIVLFALYLPAALWLGRFYTPVPRPPGSLVVPLLKIESVSASFYRSQTFIRNTKAPLMLYEDLAPIGPAEFSMSALGSFVTFSASDNSDPNTNGRHYWLVLP
jgi:hypothetical protein